MFSSDPPFANAPGVPSGIVMFAHHWATTCRTMRSSRHLTLVSITLFACWWGFLWSPAFDYDLIPGVSAHSVGWEFQEVYSQQSSKSRPWTRQDNARALRTSLCLWRRAG